MRAKRLTLTTALLVSQALVACKGGDESSTARPSATSAGAIGVAECDEYVSKYEKCASQNAPAAARGELTSNVAAMRDSWKQAAATPAARAALAQGCKQALVTAKTAMASYGCDW